MPRMVETASPLRIGEPFPSELNRPAHGNGNRHWKAHEDVDQKIFYFASNFGRHCWPSKSTPCSTIRWTSEGGMRFLPPIQMLRIKPSLSHRITVFGWTPTSSASSSRVIGRGHEVTDVIEIMA